MQVGGVLRACLFNNSIFGIATISIMSTQKCAQNYYDIPFNNSVFGTAAISIMRKQRCAYNYYGTSVSYHSLVFSERRGHTF